MKKIKVNDLVKINSNCESTRKVVYKVYAVIETAKGIKYAIINTYNDKLHKHLFNKEELLVIKKGKRKWQK